jgi:lipopolysaccharide/colanic/teichoic acid biosynthesis glycosyltransferase
VEALAPECRLSYSQTLSTRSLETETLPLPADPCLDPLSNQKQHGFYRCFGKRAFDFCVSSVALVLLSPLFALIAIAIKIGSRGPVFFAQKRVGRDAQIFRMLKFRSMAVDADQRGPGITVAGDERVTPIGKILRELKMDELPQLWNVLKGEMSLVGPRPELPSYVAQYTLEQLRVLSVCPGITDIASIRYRHEEKVLERSSNPDDFYRSVILPHKLSLNLDYVEHMSFSFDLRLILETLLSIF